MLIAIYNIEPRDGGSLANFLKKNYLVDTNDFPSYFDNELSGDAAKSAVFQLVKRVLEDRGYDLDFILFEYREVVKMSDEYHGDFYVLAENHQQEIDIDKQIKPDNVLTWQMNEVHKIIDPIIHEMTKSYPTVEPTAEFRVFKGNNGQLRVGLKELKFTIKD